MTRRISAALLGPAFAASVAYAVSAQQKKVRIVQTNAAGDNVHIIDPATNKVVGVIHGIEVSHAQAAALQTSMYHHALSVGFSRGYLVSAGIAFLALVITVITIRVRREDLAGVTPMSAGV